MQDGTDLSLIATQASVPGHVKFDCQDRIVASP